MKRLYEKNLFLTAAVFLLSLAVSSWAADVPTAKTKVKKAAANPPAPPPIRKPIVVKWTTLDGMQYYYSGYKIGLNGLKLRDVITPLNDPQANALLDKSENDMRVGLGGVIVGGGVFLAGTFTSSYNQQTNVYSVPTTSAILISVGLVAELVGRLILEEGDTSQFAAVERYNQLVRGEDEPSVENWKAVPPADVSLAFNF